MSVFAAKKRRELRERIWQLQKQGLDRKAIDDRLREPFRFAGLEDREIDAELDAVFSVGQSVYAPRSNALSQECTHDTSVGLWLAEVEPTPVRWLWPERLPLGKIVVLDGDPGLGKSLLTAEIAARVTTGRQMPDGAQGDLVGPRGVVLMAAEDDPGDTIRPRFDAAGGDPCRVRLLTGVRDPCASGGKLAAVRLPSLADIDAIEHEVNRCDAALVGIDPVMAYATGDANHEQDVRGALTPLAKMAARLGVCVLIVRHLNKSGGPNALYRGGGSIAWTAAVRSALLVAKDPNDPSGERRVIAVSKANLSRKAASLVYRVDASTVAPKIVWEGTSDHTADSLLAPPASAEDHGALREAEEWLSGVLSAGPLPAREVEERAKHDHVSSRTLARAKKALCVQTRKSGFGQGSGWLWELPQREGNQPQQLASFDAFVRDGGSFEDSEGRQQQPLAPFGGNADYLVAHGILPHDQPDGLDAACTPATPSSPGGRP